MKDGRIACLLPDGVMLSDEGSFALRAYPFSLAEAHALARQFKVRQLWLVPGSIESCGLPSVIGKPDTIAHDFLSAPGLAVPRSQTGLRPWLSVWGDGHYLEIGIPAWERSSPFHGCTFGPELVGEVLEFTEATGMLWRRSGAVTSDAWLRDHYRGKLTATEYPEIARVTNLEPDLSCVREPTETETRARYCHAFDANAMYLGAASSLSLPSGKVANLLVDRVMPDTAPGYFRYFDAWMTTPAAEYSEPELIPDECWIWEDFHRYLEPWYRMLRDARKRLMVHGASPSLAAVKAVYREGIGRFGSTRRTLAADPLYQPYWRHAVQAEARTRLQRRIAKLTQDPVAVDVDCCYFLSSVRNPSAFARRVGLPIGDEIGQFKIKGTMTARDARDVIRSGRDVIEHLREGVAA